MPLILRAIITGFGYKIGAELGRYVATRIGLIEKEKAKGEQAEEDLPEGLPSEPPGGEDDQDPEPKARRDDGPHS